MLQNFEFTRWVEYYGRKEGTHNDTIWRVELEFNHTTGLVNNEPCVVSWDPQMASYHGNKMGWEWSVVLPHALLGRNITSKDDNQLILDSVKQAIKHFDTNKIEQVYYKIPTDHGGWQAIEPLQCQPHMDLLSLF